MRIHSRAAIRHDLKSGDTLETVEDILEGSGPWDLSLGPWVLGPGLWAPGTWALGLGP